MKTQHYNTNLTLIILEYLRTINSRSIHMAYPIDTLSIWSRYPEEW